jgi:hypothetical protein
VVLLFLMPSFSSDFSLLVMTRRDPRAVAVTVVFLTHMTA